MMVIPADKPTFDRANRSIPATQVSLADSYILAGENWMQ